MKRASVRASLPAYERRRMLMFVIGLVADCVRRCVITGARRHGNRPTTHRSMASSFRSVRVSQAMSTRVMVDENQYVEGGYRAGCSSIRKTTRWRFADRARQRSPMIRPAPRRCGPSVPITYDRHGQPDIDGAGRRGRREGRTGRRRTTIRGRAGRIARGRGERSQSAG